MPPQISEGRRDAYHAEGQALLGGLRLRGDPRITNTETQKNGADSTANRKHSPFHLKPADQGRIRALSAPLRQQWRILTFERKANIMKDTAEMPTNHLKAVFCHENSGRTALCPACHRSQELPGLQILGGELVLWNLYAEH